MHEYVCTNATPSPQILFNPSHAPQHPAHRIAENLDVLLAKRQHRPQPDRSLATPAHLHSLFAHLAHEAIAQSRRLKVPRHERPLGVTSEVLGFVALAQDGLEVASEQ